MIYNNKIKHNQNLYKKYWFSYQNKKIIKKLVWQYSCDSTVKSGNSVMFTVQN
jgi:hypothetical protein